MEPYNGVSPILYKRFEQVLGSPIERIATIQRGYTPALRLRVQMQNGRSVFIKNATDEATSEELLREYAVYARLDAPFLPHLIAWDSGDADQGLFPFLVLEDLSAGYWPPPWTSRHINQVIDVIWRIAEYSLPGLVSLDEDRYLRRGWQAVAEDSLPFLSLRLATQGWLDHALPLLLAASKREILLGEGLIHNDLRSDNLCIIDERVVLVDWNLACLSNPTFDLASWLPSLEMEGGPPPEKILPDAPEHAALISGFFAARAGLPILPFAPRVREVQLQQLHSALPWAVRALGLPPLDGKNGDMSGAEEN